MQWEENAFYILHVHSSDRVNDISAQMEDALFDADSEEEEKRIQDAGRILTNPRKRAEAEASWLCGISSEQAYRLIQKSQSGSIAEADLAGSSPWNQFLVIANEMTHRVKPIDGAGIARLDACYRAVDLSGLLQAVNADRAKAGIPAIQTAADLGEGLSAAMKGTADALRRILLAEKTLPEYGEILKTGLQGNFSAFMDRMIQLYRDASFQAVENAKNGVIAEAEAIQNGQTKDLKRLSSKMAAWTVLIRPLAEYDIRLQKSCDDEIISVIGHVRGAAIDRHNDHGETRLALQIISLLWQYVSYIPDVRDHIQKDLDTLRDMMGAGASSEYANTVEPSDGKPAQKKRKGRTIWFHIKWGILILLVGLLLAEAHNYVSQTMPHDPPVKQNAQTEQWPQQKEKVAPPQAQPPVKAEEYTKPAIGGGRFTISEIRWALRQKIRLDTLKQMDLTDLGVQEYNRLVDDYNLHAGEFYYRKEDLRQAEKEVNAQRAAIEMDVRKTAVSRKWANAPRPPLPPYEKVPGWKLPNY